MTWFHGYVIKIVLFKILFNPKEPTRLTFLETEEEGDVTEAKSSKSFSRVLLVLLFVMEQATGASGKRDQS